MAVPQPQEPSTWIALCRDSRPTGGAPKVTYEAPDGRAQTISIAETAPVGCDAARLALAPGDVVWVRLVPPAIASRLGRGLLLQGGDGAPTAASEIIPLDEPSDPPGQPSTSIGNRSSAARVNSAPTRAMWAWRSELWRTEAASLFAHAASWGVGVLYVSVPIDSDGALLDPDRLRAFLREATERGIRVWAVEGDPRAVTQSERSMVAQRARALRAFNGTGSPGLHGVQYDIEPYLVPGYALNEDLWNEAYVATIEELQKAADMPIELAVPFWWLNARTASGRVMDRVVAFIESVAVMDYRTEPDVIERLAQPWLEWGDRQKRRIRVALEAGRLPDEARYHFRPAPSGTLWRMRVGEADALVLLRSPQTNPSGTVFRMVATSTFEASSVTFFGRSEQLRAMLPELEQRLGRHNSFAGIALHEVAPTEAPR
jgi:hypothetical protein